jgi:hypothetical protein
MPVLCVPDQCVPEKNIGRSVPWMMRPGIQRPLDNASFGRWVYDRFVDLYRPLAAALQAVGYRKR